MSIQPKLIIHGGAGSLEGNIGKINHIRKSLEDICDKTYTHLCSTTSYDAVQYALDLAQEGDLLVISNYDIEGIHNRLIEHKKIMETKETKKHKPKILEAV